jgi:hypothetical protein
MESEPGGLSRPERLRLTGLTTRLDTTHHVPHRKASLVTSAGRREGRDQPESQRTVEMSGPKGTLSMQSMAPGGQRSTWTESEKKIVCADRHDRGDGRRPDRKAYWGLTRSQSREHGRGRDQGLRAQAGDRRRGLAGAKLQGKKIVLTRGLRRPDRPWRFPPRPEGRSEPGHPGHGQWPGQADGRRVRCRPDPRPAEARAVQRQGHEVRRRGHPEASRARRSAR